MRKKTRKGGRCEPRQTDVVAQSGVLESRGIPHPAKVDQRAWTATGGKLGRAALLLQRRGNRHNCQRHALPKMWTNLLGPKTWGTCSEVASRTAVAAWQWLHVGRLELTALAAAQGRPAPRLCDALMTRLLMDDMVVQSGDGLVWASLGNYSWSALLYPLAVVDEGFGLRTFTWCGTGAQVKFVHVVDPRAWSVLTCRSALVPGQGVAMQETEGSRPLLEWCLRYNTASLSLDLLQQLADFLQLEGARRDRRQDLLLALVAHVFEGREERGEVERIIEQAAIAADTKKSVSLLLQDPFFEAAWEDMPHDEQFEFPEVREEKRRGRVRRHMERLRTQMGQRRKRRARVVAAEAAAPGAAPGERNVAPEGNPPAAVPAIVLAPAQDEGPAPKRPCRRPDGPLIPRGMPWGRVIDGRPCFVIARTHERGELKAITVTCHLHRADGQRCNKSLTLGSHFTEAEATLRIKEWCVAGMVLADEPGARQAHMDPMFCNPRTMPVSELRRDEVLEALVS